jgi:hypothetical protein
MKTLPNQTASESAPSKANSTLPVIDQSALDFNSSRNIAMQTQATPKQAATPTTTVTDLKSLRLPANYGATLGVKKLLTNVLVGKPKKPQFFRTNASDDMTFPAMILENKEARESYVVIPDVAQEISELVRPVMLHAAIDRQNNVSLIPVPLPGEDGTRNPWHESLAQAVEHAKFKWIRITANMHAGGYDVYEAEGELPEPEWPAHDIDALVQVAFRGKIITSLDHPVVQSLLGKI